MESGYTWENRNICVAAGVWGSPQKCVVDIQTLCLQNMFLQQTIATHPDARTKSYVSQRESTVDSPCPQKRNSPWILPIAQEWITYDSSENLDWKKCCCAVWDGKQNDPVDNIFESCYNLTEMVNAVINLRSVRIGFYRRTEWTNPQWPDPSGPTLRHYHRDAENLCGAADKFRRYFQGIVL